MVNERGTVNYIQFGFKSIIMGAKNIKSKGLKILVDDSSMPKDHEVAWGAAATVCSMMVVAQANNILDKFPPMTLASLNMNAMKMSGF